MSARPVLILPCLPTVRPAVSSLWTCIRMREECPDYRDEWDLIFRNKAQEHLRHATRLHVKPSADEIGVNNFLRNFVNHSSSRGCLNYNSSVYHNDEEHPTLVASMAALAILARAKYTETIRNVKHRVVIAGRVHQGQHPDVGNLDGGV
ncbi:transcriptional regulator family: Fungal Specific TF [Penicillium canescens]|uniref:Transcriptional regulator family: Fungal Specific TF n=1 Tax=Penicillium canescens TaxID=5083 RepID=A0AAD6ILN4_PENCN|nr:transcriptional regulator family: Fungal Specific TF [Penicillium canescens]KAJ5991610.1 transcriptional regulator family: Fungal Specific TF [Penicillium canescens]KAJ6052892.1 transcriptional regulator family: Fungal Specific TF [Penicillium canescens]KAJ6063417.1 transcriptional regulator family: Fungal Specific TF [Penicillium canescens]KAJ6089178.1 transcriptional regulator family: Fungal Specific TF [Penicillium canescens]